MKITMLLIEIAPWKGVGWLTWINFPFWINKKRYFLNRQSNTDAICTPNDKFVDKSGNRWGGSINPS